MCKRRYQRKHERALKIANITLIPRPLRVEIVFSDNSALIGAIDFVLRPKEIRSLHSTPKTEADILRNRRVYGAYEFERWGRQDLHDDDKAVLKKAFEMLFEAVKAGHIEIVDTFPRVVLKDENGNSSDSDGYNFKRWNATT